MSEPMRCSIPRLYYMVTPAFIALDYFAGLSIRVAVLDSIPLCKNLYYGFCILCGIVVFLRPRFSGVVALFESSVLLLLTVLGIYGPYLRIATLPDEELDAVLTGFTIQRVINLLLAGLIAVLGIYANKNAIAHAYGFGPSRSRSRKACGRHHPLSESDQ